MKVVNFAETNTLINSFIAEIRDINIHGDSMRFRRNLSRIGEIISYEISKQLSYKEQVVTTPLGEAKVNLPQEDIVIATILRAGLPFHEGFLNYFDRAESAFVSAYRKYNDSINFDIHIEYIASPCLDGKTLIIVDPMLATGNSMELAYKALLGKGTPSRVYLASAIASGYAVERINTIFDNDTILWVGAVDPLINEHSYIVPGIGDAGDLSFGVKE